MAEVVCDSKSFTIKLLTIVVEVRPRVQIVSHTIEAKEGQHIEAVLRVWNDGAYDIEVETLELLDSKGTIEKANWVGLITSPNIAPGEYYEKKLSTWGISRDMPAHDWTVTAKACCRPKGLL